MRKWTNVRLKLSRENTKSSSSMPNINEFMWLFLSSFTEWNTVIFFGLVNTTWTNIQWFCYLHYLGVSNTIQVSPQELHSVASQGISEGTSLAHAWPQRVSLTMKKVSMYPLHVLFVTLNPELCDLCCQGQQLLGM